MTKQVGKLAEEGKARHPSRLRIPHTPPPLSARTDLHSSRLTRASLALSSPYFPPQIALRNVRRDALKNVEKIEKDKVLSEDDATKLKDKIQKLTDGCGGGQWRCGREVVWRRDACVVDFPLLTALPDRRWPWLAGS